jgi:hypothetical protein
MIVTPEPEAPDIKQGEQPERSAASEDDAYRIACRRYARLSGRRR